MASHLGERAGQLRAEQGYWEGVRQQASAALQNRADGELRDPGESAYTDNEQERLKSQVSTAHYHLQEIAQELDRIRQLQEAEARDAAALEQSRREQELEGKDSLQRQDALEEQAAKEDRDKIEALGKDEQLKAEAPQKDREDKELFAKKESEAAQALANEEHHKQEAQHEVPPAPMADSHSEWAHVQDQIAAAWDYVDSQIQEEVTYDVAETLKAVGEAGLEVGMAVANPVSQQEAKQFFETKKEDLEHFISGEVFQAAPAKQKQQWLDEKLKDQLKAVEDEFGHRKDDAEQRKLMRDGVDALHERVAEAVKKESEIEKTVNAKVEGIKTMADEAKERLARTTSDEQALAQKMQQVDAVAKKNEGAERAMAEKDRQAAWEPVQQLLQGIETQLAQEAEKRQEEMRQEAVRRLQDTFER